MPVVFDPATDTLPGNDISEVALEGIWSFSTIEQRARIDEGLTAPLLYYSLFLRFDSNANYELTYQAYWGTRNLSDPSMRAVDIRESGQFRLDGDALQLEPTHAELTERQSGQLELQIIGNERREYLVALDGAFLNIAGACASYQVEPICNQRLDVWYSLRRTMIEWPVPALTPLSTPVR